MPLKEYRRKRRFSRSPEPRGEQGKTGARRRFVVQKHAASHLHYDFRLELGGVLKSWAVPKGPCLDPSEKRLAVEVEDHPLEYADFEGVIPAGEYGGGAVIVWDHGAWTPEGDPEQGYRKGKLAFRLEGEKLRGEWALVRMARRGREKRTNWLLIKHRDEEAKPLGEYDIEQAQPESVLTDRTVEQVAQAADEPAATNGRDKSKRKVSAGRKRGGSVAKRKKPAEKKSKRSKKSTSGRKSKLPDSFELELATLAKSPPTGEKWFHEIKFDGYRLLARVAGERVQFITRGSQDWTARFPELTAAAEKLPAKNAVLDGEAVALLPSGVSSFQALQNAFRGERSTPIVYYAFDLLYLDGRDLRGLPLEERKEMLVELLADAGAEGPLRYSEHIVGQGEEFLKQACQRGLEGIVSKRRDRPYVGGRGGDWIKAKCVQRAEFVVGGFTEPARSRQGLGALLVGYYDDHHELTYAGRVGTGFNARMLHDLRVRLDKLEQRRSPFAQLPRRDSRSGTHWVAPELVAQVEFANWTDDGILRQPSFQGLREDKPAKNVGREEPLENKPRPGRSNAAPGPKIAASRAAYSSSPKRAGNGSRGGASSGAVHLDGVTLTHPNRVLYPDQGITKLALATYYAEIADWILPHLADRPLSLVRCPSGRQKNCFFQKHLGPEAPEALARTAIEEKHGTNDYAVVKDAAGLVALVQLGVLEIHPWGSRVDDIDRPDRMIFDLDPGPGAAWRQVIEGARRVREKLELLSLASFVKTTGGKGLHVVVPLLRRHAWDEVKRFSRAVARQLADESPEDYLINPSKSLRKGKIFVDYLRNDRGATAVAPYSTRALEAASLSIPIAWDMLSEDLRSNRFTVNDLPDWLSSRRRDPWKAISSVRQSLTKAAKKALGVD